jgi:galactoside O-acetyltransferase
MALGIKHVGKNVLISEHAIIVGLENITIGNNVRIDGNVVILAKRGELSVGSNVHIEPSSSLIAHYGIEIGDFCTISHGVRLFTASADYSGDYFTNVFPDPVYQSPIKGKIRLGNHVIIGGNSVVMPNLEIAEGAAIGALSFVRYSLTGWRIYGGNPLRDLGERKQKIKFIGEKLLSDSENTIN